MVRFWLIKARRDFDTARQIATLPGAHLEIAMFHCHRAAERTLKGFLTFHGHSLDPTLNLPALVAAARQYEPGFAGWDDAALILHPCGADDHPVVHEASREAFLRALDAASQFVAFVPMLLPREVHAG